MAHPTSEQADAARHLIREYGEPSLISIEFTSRPYGLLRIMWGEGDHAERRLYVNPKGERLSWRTLDAI